MTHGLLKQAGKTATVIGAAALILTSQAVALAGQPDDGFVAGPARQIEAQEIAPFATLHPTRDNELRFVEVRGEGGRIEGVGIIELSLQGNSSTARLDVLQGANPMEVFNALSPRGTAIPDILVEIYGPAELGVQGFGLVEGAISVDEGEEPATDVSYTEPTRYKSYPRQSGCRVRYGAYPQDWYEALEYGLNNYSHHFLSAFNGPLTQPQDWHYAPAYPSINDGGPYYDFYGEALGATAFAPAVQLCDTAFFYHHNGTIVGKDVYLYTRPASTNSSDPWQYIFYLGKLDAVDKLVSFTFVPNVPLPADAPAFDYRLEIENASAATSLQGPGTQGDRFYIGATWQIETNSDFPTDD